MSSQESDRLERYSMRNLQDFITQKMLTSKAGGGDFIDIAETLDPECVVRQQTWLPYGGN